jgi:hypothetical protein
MGENVKRYKSLLSSAPAHSILNAQAFHYTNSVATDIRKTFARIRRERPNPAVIVDIASHVRCLTTKTCDTALPRRSVQSTGR